MAYDDEGVIVTDFNWRILHANEAAGRLLGIPSADLVGTNIRDTYTLKTLEVGVEGIRQLQAGQELRLRRELRQPNKGEAVLVDVYWRPLEDGRLRGMLRPVKPADATAKFSE